MSNIRKWLSLTMMFTMVIVLLAGCTGGDNKAEDIDTGETPAPSGTGTTTGNSDGEGTAEGNSTGTESYMFKKYEAPVTITSAQALRESDTLLPGDTPEDNPMSRWLRDNMGVTLKYKWLLTDQNDALATKIRLALASGEELPDVLYISDTVLMNELIDAGRLEPIDEAYEKYATNRMRESYEKNPEVWRYVEKDGKKWGLPQISDGIVGDPIMWVRQDWLDAVGMKAPTTLEEVEATLAAFKQKYPDKTPLAFSGKNGLAGYMGDVHFMFGQTQPYIWDKGEDGKLRYGAVQPTVKDGLLKLKDFYASGYIHPEFGAHDEQKAASLFTSGEAGMLFGPGWMGGWPLADTEVNVPGAVVKPYPLPSGVDGTIGRTGSALSYGTYVFRKGFEYMDAAFHYWDISLGVQLEDPNSPFANGYAEGYDYIMVDGKPQWDFPDKPTTEIGNYQLLGSGNTPPGMIQGPSIYERVAKGQIESVYEKKLAAGTGKLVVDGFTAALSQPNIARRNQFIGAPTETMGEKWTLLKKMELETFLKIIYNKADANAFDEFVEDWKAQGGDKITEEVNEWYQP
ncbi:extracellular solute-binding protein [Paenibacillus sepulcri]|uniref:ABC transporter substrate-binding protein n=1 Tax=Paenibacillus sepulcri TaxID=359917 RepID=A0ABS7BYY7_9BACL|nr:ABC transporter substrate-binding protein [Paenibacillus sepulcri]